ncbi:MAG: aminodeoxychorismate synthase component I, partial [Spirochaeta sp.]
CLIDVENRHPRVLKLEEIDSGILRFSTPLGGNCPVEKVRSQPILSIRNPLSRSRYHQGFHRIQAGLKRGDSFLANLTYPVDVECSQPLHEVFFSSQALFRLWWKDHFTVFSPEKFITISTNGTAATFPMKGTISADIPDAANRLRDNAKEAAEHLTVVDLLRNDLGRIGTKVRVERFRYLERIHSPAGDILQASSEIRAELGKNWQGRIGSLLAEILPAGSITGAPKRRTLELISEAEGEQRGYYTGIIGYFDGSQFCSGVMIRFIEERAGGLPDSLPLQFPRFRSGGGITIYSDEEEEYHELHTKIRIPSG